MAGLNVSERHYDMNGVDNIELSAKEVEVSRFKEDLYKAIKDPDFDPDEFLDSLLA
jgi:hypothetical protein